MNDLGYLLDKKEGYGDSNWDPSEIGPLIINKAIDYISENAKKNKHWS